MGKREARWQVKERAKIDAMTNDELFSYLVEAMKDYGRSDYDSYNYAQDAFTAEYTETVMHARLREAGFLK